MNRVELIGFVAREPEISETTNKTKLAKFSIAVSKIKSEKGEADFFNVVAWKTNADVVEKFVKKGSRIGISGYLQTRTYDSENGKRTVVDVVVDTIDLLSPKSANSDAQQESTDNLSNNTLTSDSRSSVGDSDLPF